MLAGRSLTELAQEIERQSKAKQDYVADTREMRIIIEGGSPVLEFGPNRLSIRPTAHSQLATKTGIPARYYDRMREANPELLAMNVNAWFQQEPERRMIRTLDGAARAILSDRYQRIDHDSIAEVALPVLADIPGMRIASAEITDRKLYIKAVNERLRLDVRVGDPVEAGVLITNSEIGDGAVSISGFVHRLVCLNGMVVPDQKFRRNHVGRRTAGDEIYAALSDEAMRADDHAILLKVRDVVRGALNEARFAQTVARLRDAAASPKMDDPVKAIETLAQKTGLIKTETTSILKHLIDGGDITQYGLLNAVTRAAQDVDSYDRSTELEAIGGRVLDLQTSEWSRLSLAA